MSLLFWPSQCSVSSSAGPLGGAAVPRTRMMYSPEPMEGKRRESVPEAGELEERVTELEGLVEALGRAPEGELVRILDRAVGLLGEINAGLEKGLSSAEAGAQDLGNLLERVDFGPFDAALEELERGEDLGSLPDSGSGGTDQA